QTAARGKLVTAKAGDHEVLGDHGRARVRLAMLRISMLDGPQLLAGLGIERDDKTVKRVEDHLALGIVEAAVDGIAAGARNGRLVTVGRLHVVPDLLRIIRIAEIQSLDHVAESHARTAA